MDINIIIENFIKVDDYFQKEMNNLKKYPLRKRKSKSGLSLSEKVCISLLYHLSDYSNFKSYYINEILCNHLDCFPKAVKYNTFIEYQDEISYYLYFYLDDLVRSKHGFYNIVDATPLRVCHNKRINNHKVFKGIAERGCNSMGYFYGFKLHLVINEKGEIIGYSLTEGNVDDRVGLRMMNYFFYGNIYGDKGYVSSELEELFRKIGVNYKTKIKKKMKKTNSVLDEYFLRQRKAIETVIGQLKSKFKLEHSRHRSLKGFIRHVLSALISYQLNDKKVKLKLMLPLLKESF